MSILTRSVTLLAVASLGIPSAIASQSPAQGDEQWLMRTRMAALDILMPVSAPEILVAYRRIDSIIPSAIEKYFGIRFEGPDGFRRDRLTATLVVPAEVSVQQQLL